MEKREQSEKVREFVLYWCAGNSPPGPGLQLSYCFRCGCALVPDDVSYFQLVYGLNDPSLRQTDPRPR